MASKKIRFNAIVTFSMSGVVNDGVQIESFIDKNNDYMAEPKNADGCIVAMRVQRIEVLPKKNRKGIEVE